jgi:signal transduction histidine kinase
VHLRCYAGPEGGLFIDVVDSGPGIPERDLPRVIEPFHRPVDSNIAVASDSNGLGLPLTHRLMAMHGGRLALANAPAGGLVATLQFPASRTSCLDDCGSDASGGMRKRLRPAG